MEKPYVISAELDLANRELEKIVRPERIESFRESLDTSLRAMGKDTVWVASSTMKGGLETALSKTRLPIVSLDDRYVTSAEQYIGISRGVDEQLNDVGYLPRVGYSSIERQLGKLPALGNEIVIADDVLFSGEMISWLADALEPYGVKIGGLVCGIAIQEGIDKLQLKGIDVAAAQVFDDVEDEICERDFAVVPGSGRRVANRKANALYFDPVYGRPSAWASIPEKYVKTFAATSYDRSSSLVQPDITMSDIGNFLGWPGSDGSTTAAEALDEEAMWAYSRASGVPPLF